ncbi:MAG: GNAT family N-acetyltransferase [Clostridia bacterium]|nr:GNAT family N-acetyltransferase [Clostridia bacterium]
MLELKDLTKNTKYKIQVKKLYKKAFPANERPPFGALWRKAKKGKGELYAATNKDMFVGLTHAVIYKNLVYVYFLAVEKNNRGKGFGSKILAELKNKYKDYNIVLNIEELDENVENFEDRLNRKKFYEKNGFRLTGIKTIEKGVRYDLMLCGEDTTYKEFASLIKNFAGKLIYKLYFRQG